MRTPDVSALLAAFNASKYLGAAIESVLSQTHPDVECVVVDDGSTDDTSSIAEGYGERVTVIRQPNSGVSAARNAAARAAKGRYVAFLDADDVWLPTKVEKQLAIASTGSFGLIYGGYLVADESLQPLYEVTVPRERDALSNSVLLRPPGINIAQTGMVPRLVFAEVGGFDERLSVSADLDLGLRIALRHSIVAINEPLALYRRHAFQMSDDHDRMESDAKLVLDKFYFDPNVPEELKGRRSESLSNLHLILAAGHVNSGRRAAGVTHLFRAVRHHLPTAARGVARRLTGRGHV